MTKKERLAEKKRKEAISDRVVFSVIALLLVFVVAASTFMTIKMDSIQISNSVTRTTADGHYHADGTFHSNTEVEDNNPVTSETADGHYHADGTFHSNEVQAEESKIYSASTGHYHDDGSYYIGEHGGDEFEITDESIIENINGHYHSDGTYHSD